MHKHSEEKKNRFLKFLHEQQKANASKKEVEKMTRSTRNA